LLNELYIEFIHQHNTKHDKVQKKVRKYWLNPNSLHRRLREASATKYRYYILPRMAENLQ